MCAEKATQLQYQLKENAEELQDFMRDLANWEDAIKNKDLELSAKSDDIKTLKNNIPPIRSRQSRESTKTKKKQKPERLKAYDYRAWDKFDVALCELNAQQKRVGEQESEEKDKACDAVDISSEEEEEEEEGADGSNGDDSSDRARLMQQAVFEKDAGNDKFKLGLYEEAIEHYTLGIQCDPLNSILPANRAMALLKLERFAAAEVDCTTSLDLDPTYVKAFCRRGAARQQLKKFAEAKEDFLSALQIDPGNKQAKEEVKKLNKLLEISKASLVEIQAGSTERAMPGIVEPVNIPSHLRSKKPLRRVKVEEIGNTDIKMANPEEMAPPYETLEQNTSYHRIIEKKNEPMPQTGLSHASDSICDSGEFMLKPSHKVFPGSSQSGLISENEAVEDVTDIVSNICAKQTVINAKSAAVPASAKSDEKEILIPPVPKTPIQFQLDWRKLQHDSNALFKYFCNIDPKNYKRLFKEFLEADMLSSILSLLQDFYITNDLDVALVLENLAKVSRFSTMIMFASDQDKQTNCTESSQRVHRLLAILERDGEFGLFIYIPECSELRSDDITLESAIAIDGHFTCDVSKSFGIEESDIDLLFAAPDKQLRFQLTLGPACNTFVSEIYRVVELCQHQSLDFPPDHRWINDYKLTKAFHFASESPMSKMTQPAGLTVDDLLQFESIQTADNKASSSVQSDYDKLESGKTNDNIVGFEDNFTENVKLPTDSHKTETKKKEDNKLLSPTHAQKPIDRDVWPLMHRSSFDLLGEEISSRDGIIKRTMETKESEYTDIQTFRVFVGTWNVNGQSATIALQNWLTQDPDPPDIYAVGFQELDLSKEAFLFNDSPKEEEWYRAVTNGLHPGAEYKLVKLIRLVGMMLIVYIQVKHFDQIVEVSAESVGTGIMGKMGNKGGVAVRFMLHNSTFCFVNSHLAAHVEEFERRNQDYNEICSRMLFHRFDPPLSIRQHDVIIWLGDLNYRLDQLTNEQVEVLISRNQFAKLQEYDQLYRQKKLGRVFSDYHEGAVTFKPTYKYDPGTDQYDSSEKCRVPAWCDRILWKGQHINQLAYRHHPKLKISDHKPVSSLFEIGVKVTDVIKFKKVYEDLMKQLDKLENEYLPQVALDTMELQFGNVMFVEPSVQYLTVANTGQVPVEFEFIRKLDDVSYCKEWLTISPYKECILPGDTQKVRLEIYIDSKIAGKLNSGLDRIEDILVLHLLGGKDIFVTVSGTYIPSSFGSSLDALCHMPGPIRDVPVANLIDLEQSDQDLITPKGIVDGSEPPYDIPKEIWTMLNHLYEFGIHHSDLFQQPGLHAEIIEIRNALDTGITDRLPGSVHSVAEALLMFLEALPEAVIPAKYYSRALRASSDVHLCEQLLSELPTSHGNVFRYLMAFLRTFLSYVESNKPDTAERLALLFGQIILRVPPEFKQSVQTRETDAKKAALILNFISE